MSTSKDLLSNLLIFTAGAAIGSAVTYILMKRKQESVEEVYEEVEQDQNEEEPEKLEPPANDAKGFEFDREAVRYNKFVKSYGGDSIPKEEKKKEVKDVERPYVIAPEEFDEMDGYSSESLYYYADGVLTDEYDNAIDDADDIIGDDILEEFGSHKEYSSLYVRDDVRKVDYEILKDLSSYAEKYRVED